MLTEPSDLKTKAKELHEALSVELSEKQYKTIEHASNAINIQCQTRGAPSVSLLSLLLPISNKRKTNEIPISGNLIYDHDKRTVNLLYALFGELDAINDQLMKQESLLVDKERTNILWKMQVDRNEADSMKYKKAVKTLESRIIRLQVQLTDLKSKKTASENKLREIVSNFKTLKEQKEIKGKLCSNERKYLRKCLSERRVGRTLPSIEKIQSSKNSHIDTKHGQLLAARDFPRQLEALSIENTNLKEEIEYHYGFLNNLYECLLEQKDTDGMAPIQSSFIPQVKKENLHHEKNRSLLSFDSKLNSLIKSMQREPIGLDDTFKSYRIGTEKHKEVKKLKQELKDLNGKYETALEELKRVKSKSSYI